MCPQKASFSSAVSGHSRVAWSIQNQNCSCLLGQHDKFIYDLFCFIFRCLEKLLKPVSLLIVFQLDLGTLKGKIVISKKQPENPDHLVSVSLDHKRGRFLSGGKAKEGGKKKKKARVFILTDSRLLCVQEIQCLWEEALFLHCWTHTASEFETAAVNKNHSVKVLDDNMSRSRRTQADCSVNKLVHSRWPPCARPLGWNLGSFEMMASLPGSSNLSVFYQWGLEIFWIRPLHSFGQLLCE